MSHKIFCVGLNGKPGNLEAILERYASHIHEVFVAVPPYLMGSGRAGADPLTLDKMAKQTEIAHGAGVGYNVLLNAVCLGGRQFHRNFQKQLYEFLECVCEANVDALTIADPFILQKAVAFRKSKGAEFTICVSSLADLTEAVSAKRYEDMGPDRIVLHQNVNRDFQAIRQIQEAVSCELELYANTGSLYKCPYRQAHRAYISHLSILTSEQLKEPENYNWFKANCISIRKKNPLEIIMAPTIRPEDLHYYEELGVRLFKISSRTMTTEWVTRVLSTYVNRSFNGSLPDLCDTNLGRDMPWIDNKMLDGLLEFIQSRCNDVDYDYEACCRKFFHERIHPDIQIAHRRHQL